ncbi:MAG: 1-(5-phosphoribosyl)-5-[(5-phosphoribosylamino)methylideneamino]imidazole-4-carboxamide isomerase [Planctomycetes bacterium]|nr:1-(5-phosphoribosyl)-5-[(5-phosphoribosylamino)methylideneamino]imidazole-4-carboxamide isomerase [Planctomycetota bacterium]
MKLIPAIDLRGGRCVRLIQGRIEEEKAYGEDPAARARSFAADGAPMLHVVDLDGAFAGLPRHGAAIEAICRAVAVPVQVGGGVRDDASFAARLAAGASRVVVGTRALEDPSWVRDLARRHPGRVVVGVDERGGVVAARGWVHTSETRAMDLARLLRDAGVAALVHTDVGRDGTLRGPNLAALEAVVLAASPLPVIASGGVGTLAHLRALAGLPLEGVIVGKALYEGRFTLTEAIAALA